MVRWPRGNLGDYCHGLVLRNLVVAWPHSDGLADAETATTPQVTAATVC